MDSVEKDWLIAQNENSFFSYRKFLKEHPQSPYEEEAMLRLRDINDEIRWNNVKDDDDVWGYNHYLDNFPNGKFVVKAKARLRELAEENLWEEVQTENTIRSYTLYISKFPFGKFVQAAKEGILHIEQHETEKDAFCKARRIKSIDAYHDFLQRFPNGVYAKEAQQDLSFLEHIQQRIEQKERFVQNGGYSEREELDWRIANSKNTLEGFGDYYKKYPKGRYVEQAKEKIEGFERKFLDIELKRQEIELWKTIQIFGEKDKCLEYLQKFPDGKYFYRVKEKLKELKMESFIDKTDNPLQHTRSLSIQSIFSMDIVIGIVFFVSLIFILFIIYFVS